MKSIAVADLSSPSLCVANSTFALARAVQCHFRHFHVDPVVTATGLFFMPDTESVAARKLEKLDYAAWLIEKEHKQLMIWSWSRWIETVAAVSDPLHFFFHVKQETQLRQLHAFLHHSAPKKLFDFWIICDSAPVTHYPQVISPHPESTGRFWSGSLREMWLPSRPSFSMDYLPETRFPWRCLGKVPTYVLTPIS